MNNESAALPQPAPLSNAPAGAAAFMRRFFRMPLTAPRRSIDVLAFLPADTVAWAQWRASGIVLYGSLPPASALGDDADVHRFAAMIEAELTALAFTGELVSESPLPKVKDNIRGTAAEHALRAIAIAAERRGLPLRHLSQGQVAAACGASGAARTALEGAVRGEGLGTIAEGGPSVRECQAILWAHVFGLEHPPAVISQPAASPSVKPPPKRKPQPAVGMERKLTKAQLAAIRARKVAKRGGR